MRGHVSNCAPHLRCVCRVPPTCRPNTAERGSPQGGRHAPSSGGPAVLGLQVDDLVDDLRGAGCVGMQSTCRQQRPQISMGRESQRAVICGRTPSLGSPDGVWVLGRRKEEALSQPGLAAETRRRSSAPGTPRRAGRGPDGDRAGRRLLDASEVRAHEVKGVVEDLVFGRGLGGLDGGEQLLQSAPPRAVMTGPSFATGLTGG